MNLSTLFFDNLIQDDMVDIFETRRSAVGIMRLAPKRSLAPAPVKKEIKKVSILEQYSEIKTFEELSKLIGNCVVCGEGLQKISDPRPSDNEHIKVLVLSEHLLSYDEEKYLEQILGSINLFASRGDYVTLSALKCRNIEEELKASALAKCFNYVRSEILLYPQSILLVFGKDLVKIFSSHSSDFLSFVLVNCDVLEIKTNKTEKKILWGNLKKMKEFLSRL